MHSQASKHHHVHHIVICVGKCFAFFGALHLKRPRPHRIRLQLGIPPMSPSRSNPTWCPLQPVRKKTLDTVDLLWGTDPCQSFGPPPHKVCRCLVEQDQAQRWHVHCFQNDFPWTKVFSHCRINFYQLHFRRPQICSLTTWYSWWKKFCTSW